MALATKQVQTLLVLLINDMQYADTSVIIHVQKLLKHSRQNNYETGLTIEEFSNPSIFAIYNYPRTLFVLNKN